MQQSKERNKYAQENAQHNIFNSNEIYKKHKASKSTTGARVCGACATYEVYAAAFTLQSPIEDFDTGAKRQWGLVYIYIYIYMIEEEIGPR